MNPKNRYNPDRHDDFILCPRKKCQSRNAPKESDDFKYTCWNCSARLPVESEVSVGDIVEVDVFDFHESGAGVGRIDSGFIIITEGALPEAKYEVKITRVSDSHAEGEALQKLSDEIEDEGSEGEDNGKDEDERLGSRENFWGT